MAPRSGKDILFDLAATTPDQQEKYVEKTILDGNVPNYLRTPKTFRAPKILLSDGSSPTFDFSGMPDFVAMGTDTDFMYAVMRPETAANIADAVFEADGKFSMSLPTKRLCAFKFMNAASVVPLPVVRPPEAVTMGPAAASVAAWQHSTQLALAYAAQKNIPFGSTLKKGTVADGHRKNLVTGPNATGNKVIIYGGMNTDGTFPIQPLSDVHPSTYFDYSHGIWLVHRKCWVDGKVWDLWDVCNHPLYWPLVSNQGPFIPDWPTTTPVTPAFPVFRNETYELATTPKPASLGPATPPPTMPDAELHKDPGYHPPEVALIPDIVDCNGVVWSAIAAPNQTPGDPTASDVNYSAKPVLEDAPYTTELFASSLGDLDRVVYDFALAQAPAVAAAYANGLLVKDAQGRLHRAPGVLPAEPPIGVLESSQSAQGQKNQNIVVGALVAGALVAGALLLRKR